jgi:hypothetical protein
MAYRKRAGQRREHRPGRLPLHIGRYGRQLHLRPFQGLLEAVDLRRPFPDQGGAVARQLSQFALLALRDETTREFIPRRRYANRSAS